MKKIFAFVSLIFSLQTFQSANAGINGLTIHSRANCVNNESITWDLTQNWSLMTSSDHGSIAEKRTLHSFSTGWTKTWRSGAVHWSEGGRGWFVHGWHWINNLGRVYSLGDEVVQDCSIYDGWWDY